MYLRFWALPLLSLLGFAIYAVNLQHLGRLLGFQPINPDIRHLILFVVWCGLAALVFPREMRRPSDIFLAFYILICFLWSSSMWDSTRILAFQDTLLLLALLFLPAVAIVAASWLATGRLAKLVPSIAVIDGKYLYLPLVLLLVTAAVTGVVVVGSGDFGWANVYDRRLSGREALAGHVFAGYILNMTANGVAPLLGFIAGRRRQPLLFAVAAGYVVLLYWLMGLKFPFLCVVALTGIGCVFGLRSWRHRLTALMLVGLLVIYAVTLVDAWQTGYSALANYLVRRITLVQPQVQSYYLDAWLALDWRQRLTGISLGEFSDVTYLIGARYLDNPLSNANVDAFLLALLKYGLAGYLAAVIVVAGFNFVVDVLYARTQMAAYVGLGALYGILVSEQAFTTALVSSGIFLCLALVALFSYPTKIEPPASMESENGT